MVSTSGLHATETNLNHAAFPRQIKMTVAVGQTESSKCLTLFYPTTDYTLRDAPCQIEVAVAPGQGGTPADGNQQREPQNSWQVELVNLSLPHGP